MPTYAELMEILKANEIRGYSPGTRSKLIDLLFKRRLIPKNMILISKKKQRKILILNIIF